MSKQQRSLSRAMQRPARCEGYRAVPVAMQDCESPCWTHESVAIFHHALSSCLKISLLWSNKREREGLFCFIACDSVLLGSPFLGPGREGGWALAAF